MNNGCQYWFVVAAAAAAAAAADVAAAVAVDVIVLNQTEGKTATAYSQL